jgi:transcriptional regulator with XRE-family HTH domain
MSKRNRKRGAEIVDLVNKLLPEEPEFSAELQNQISRRRLVAQLADLRNLKGISQADVAEQLQCTQSKVSKLENGYDDDVNLRALVAYAKLFDSDLTILFSSKEDSLASQIQYHAFCIKTCFEKMNELVRQDAQIGKGVAAFHIEALLNLVKIVEDSSHHLVSSISPSVEPQVQLQIQDIKKDINTGSHEPCTAS